MLQLNIDDLSETLFLCGKTEKLKIAVLAFFIYISLCVCVCVCVCVCDFSAQIFFMPKWKNFWFQKSFQLQ